MNTKTKRLRKHRKAQIVNKHSMPVTARRFLSLILWTVIVSPVMPYASAQDVSEPVRQSTRSRRVLYNFDGDSCLSTKAGSKGPVAVCGPEIWSAPFETEQYDGSASHDTDGLTLLREARDRGEDLVAPLAPEALSIARLGRHPPAPRDDPYV